MGGECQKCISEEDIEYTYFIKAKKLGHIKIGVSNNVARRLKDLQACSPDKLILLGKVPNNGHTAEKVVHNTFQHYRLHGEWFQGTVEIHKIIAGWLAEDRVIEPAKPKEERSKFFGKAWTKRPVINSENQISFSIKGLRDAKGLDSVIDDL